MPSSDTEGTEEFKSDCEGSETEVEDETPVKPVKNPKRRRSEVDQLKQDGIPISPPSSGVLTRRQSSGDQILAPNFCPWCGTKSLAKTAKFCHNCGERYHTKTPSLTFKPPKMDILQASVPQNPNATTVAAQSSVSVVQTTTVSPPSSVAATPAPIAPAISGPPPQSSLTKFLKPILSNPTSAYGPRTKYLSGRVFCLTGAMSQTRNALTQLIHHHGGGANSSVTGTVTHLLSASPDMPTSKFDRACELSIPIYAEDYLYELIAAKGTHSHDLDIRYRYFPKPPPAGSSPPTTPGGAPHPHPLPQHKPQSKPKSKTVNVLASSVVSATFSTSSSSSSSSSYQGSIAVNAHVIPIAATSPAAGKPLSRSLTGTNIPNAKPITVLLAKTYSKKTDPTGWWISEKLDGVRAVWDGRGFYSRQGNRFFAPEFFSREMPRGVVLDGELWMGRKKFQQTVSICRQQGGGDRWKQICYRVFDAPEHPKPFEQRLAYLKQVIPSTNPYASVVEHVVCQGKDHMEKELKAIEQIGGEGIMLRQPGSMYEHTRSSTLLKLKSFCEQDALVIGYVRGNGRNAGRVGALRCRLASGTEFNCGTGLTDALRNNPPAIGSVVVVKYQELSGGGVPRFPAFGGERADGVWPPQP